MKHNTDLFLKFRSSVIVLFFLMISSNLIYSQGKGKVIGRVIDDQTNEPLPGVNVYLEGATIGTTSDEKGKFFLLNLYPGKHSISASMVGYGKVTQTGVEVFIDRTTEINFRLKDESIQIQQVVITAEKPKIIKDQTSSSNTMDDEQIKAAPIEGIRGVLELSSSFQKNAQGNYSIRGSGAYEISFQVNGVEQINSNTSSPAGTAGSEKANNSWKYDVNPIAVQQVQVISGGFTAEYGNAQAGVVKVVLKEGSPKLSGEFRMEYRPSGQYHFGEYLYDKNNFEWQTWGNWDYWLQQMPNKFGSLDQVSQYLYDKIYVKKNATAEDSLRAVQEIRWAYDTWVKNHTPSEDNPLGVYDYRDRSYKRYLFGLGGPLGTSRDLLKFYFSGEYRIKPTRLPTPEKDQVYQYYTLNLTYQPFSGHKFKMTGTFQKYKGSIWSGSDDIRWSGIAFVPGGSSTKYLVTVDPVRTEQTISQNLNYVYAINSNSFLETNIAHQQESYELPYHTLRSFDLEADRLDSLGDPRGVILKRGTWWLSDFYRGPFNFSTNYYQDSRTNHWSLSLDYTNQISASNTLKSGLRFYYWDMFNNAVNSSFQANTYIVRSGYAEYYRAYPLSAAVYMQDKMEYEGLIANIGFRYETYNFQYNIPVDEFNPFYPGTDGVIGNPETKPSPFKSIFLPRFGVSFPIGENTAFRIAYGHFASMPIFSQALSQRTDKGWLTRGNPDLDYKKTIQYEFGLQQVFENENRLDFSIYYNDRVRQIGLQRIAAFSGSQGAQGGIISYSPENIPLYPYTTYSGNSFGATIGIEVVFEKISSGNWGYRLSYNLSQTTDGRYGPTIMSEEGPIYTGKSEDRPSEVISYNDRTHNFRGYLQYTLKENEGFSMLGVHPLSNTLFGLTYTAQSGTPFTYTTEFEAQDAINNRRYPLESNFDFNFQKTIKITGVSFIVGLRVMNLFNNKLLTPLDFRDDLVNWVEKGITMDDPANNIDRRSYKIASFKTYKNVPRQIFLTFGIGI